MTGVCRAGRSIWCAGLQERALIVPTRPDCTVMARRDRTETLSRRSLCQLLGADAPALFTETNATIPQAKRYSFGRPEVWYR